MKKTNYDYIVIGGGTHGLSSTFHLSNLSSSVALFEQFTIGHEKGSSHGPTRINRSAYEELFYTKLNRLCLQQYWPLMQKTLQKKFIHKNPFFVISQVEEIFKGYEKIAKVTEGLKFVELKDAKKEYEKFPNLQTEFKLIFDEFSSLIKSGDYIQAVKEYLLNKKNVNIFENSLITMIKNEKESVLVQTESEKFYAKKVILTCGHWIQKLFPEIKSITNTIEQTLIYVDLHNIQKYKIGSQPAFTHRKLHSRYYCLPDCNGSGVKIGGHQNKLDPINKSKQEKVKVLEDLAKGYFGKDFIGIKKVENCWYTNTKTQDFIIDWIDPGIDRILVCSCCSGHSFKLTPIIGKIVGDLVSEGKTIELVEKEGHRFKIPYHEGVNLK